MILNLLSTQAQKKITFSFYLIGVRSLNLASLFGDRPKIVEICIS